MDAYQEICAKNSAYDIKRIDDPAFKQYGTLWNEFDLTELEAFCNKNVKIDSEKNFYVPSKKMQSCSSFLPAPYLKCTAIHFTTARSKFMLQASKSSSFCRRVQISLSLKNSVLKTSESLRKTSSSSSTPAEKIKSRPVLKSALLEI